MNVVGFDYCLVKLQHCLDQFLINPESLGLKCSFVLIDSVRHHGWAGLDLAYTDTFVELLDSKVGQTALQSKSDLVPLTNLLFRTST